MTDALDTASLECRDVSPERLLWLAVIRNAVEDACYASNWSLAASEGHGGKVGYDPEPIRSEARRWLVSDIDPWRSERELVCDLAGVDASDVVRMARPLIAEAKRHDAAREDAARQKLQDHLEAGLAKLIAAEATGGHQVDARLRKLAEMEVRAT